jgi:ATP phosphoribosyltransferase
MTNQPTPHTEILRLAIQKNGRLKEGSVQLLKECGLHFTNGSDQLRTRITNFPMEILFLRDDDIPQYVEDNVADIGIIGENILAEKQKSTQVRMKLGFAKCRLSIAVPREEDYNGTVWLSGKNIATSYPVITRRFLGDRGIRADIHEISGSVEIAPGIGLASAIADLVSTGSTLHSNGLKEVEMIMESEAVLVSHPTISPSKQALLESLQFRIEAVQKAKSNKYILLNCPNTSIEQITQVIPGMKSPTILPLQKQGWSSLHSVVNENDFWLKIDQLKALGAEGILVIPIEKMIY